MQEQIRQERAYNTALRGASRPFKEGTIRTFDRGTQPPTDVQTDPGKISVVRNGLFDQVMRDGIKKDLMSRSITQSNAQHRFRATPTASSADRPGR